MFLRTTGIILWIAALVTRPESSLAQDSPPAAGPVVDGQVGIDGSNVTWNGTPIQLLGYGHGGYIYNRDSSYFESWLDRLAQYKINYLRISVAPIPQNWRVNGKRPLQPIVKSGGKYRFDQLNPKFWRIFEQLATQAAARGIVVVASIWECYSLKTKKEYRFHPLHPRKGGILLSENQTAFPEFWTQIIPEIETYNKLVLTELSRYRNVIVETANEPGEHGAGVPAVEAWHQRLYALRDSIRPDLPIMVNLVPHSDGSFYPNANHPGVDLVSVHGTTGLAETAEATVKRIRDLRLALGRGWLRFPKPIVADSDGLTDNGKNSDGRQLYRGYNAFVHTWGVAALRGGFGFNHLEKDAWAPPLDDLAALDALRSAREVASSKEDFGTTGWLPLGGRFEFPVGSFPDLAIDEQGRAHAVFIIGYRLFYAHFDGSSWRSEVVTDVANVRRKFNLPKIAIVGERVYVVHGPTSFPGNGLFVRHRLSEGRWSEPLHLGRRDGRNQITDWFETFDTTSFQGTLQILATNLRDGSAAYLERITVQSDDTWSIAELLRAPEGFPDLAADPNRMYFAGSFRGVRMGSYTQGGLVSSLVQEVRPGSAGYAQVAVSSSHAVAYAWVRWGRLHPQKSDYEPMEIWVRPPQGADVLVADVRNQFCTGVIDLAFDLVGRPVVVYDLGGKVVRSRVGAGGAVTSTTLAYGLEPQIGVRGWGMTVLFSGPRSGAVHTMAY